MCTGRADGNVASFRLGRAIPIAGIKTITIIINVCDKKCHVQCEEYRKKKTFA